MCTVHGLVSSWWKELGKRMDSKLLMNEVITTFLLSKYVTARHQSPKPKPLSKCIVEDVYNLKNDRILKLIIILKLTFI